MEIKSLYDWNTRLARCGSCRMPEHPYPRLQMEEISVSTEFKYTNKIANSIYTRTLEQTWTGGGYIRININQAWQAKTSFGREIAPIYVRTVQNVPPFTGYIKTSYLNQINVSQTAQQAEQAVRNGILESDFHLSYDHIITSIGQVGFRRFDDFGENHYGMLNWKRFRFHPPESQPEPKFTKITYDLIFVGKDQQYHEGTFLESRTCELTSPGPSEWVTINPPLTDGSIFAVNVAYITYRTKYGIKPTFFDVWPVIPS